MSFAKDKIIDDLHAENQALKTGPTAAATASQDLRASEHTLKFSLDERVIVFLIFQARLEADLRAQEDRDSLTINRLDGERVHLKVTERKAADEAAALRAELALLRSTVDKKLADSAHLRRIGDDLRASISVLNGDIATERKINADIRIDVDRTNVAIDAGSAAASEKRGRIDALHGQISHSKAVQDDLHKTLYDKDQDRAAKLSVIDGKNLQIVDLEEEIKRRETEIGDLRYRIGIQSNAAYVASKDATGYAVRNNDLDARISSLKINVDDRHREIGILNGRIADLNELYSRRRSQNVNLEYDINHLSQKVDTLSIHNRGIGHQVQHEADRAAYVFRDYGRADYLAHKQRVFEDDARSSALHVDRVVSNSPARSPRRYY